MQSNERVEIQTIGERLKMVRGDRTQQEFADELGVSLSSLRRYEGGDRDPDADFLIALNRRHDAAWVLFGSRRGSDHLSSEDVAFSLAPSMSMELRERERIYHAALSADDMVDLVRNGTYVWVPFYDLPLSGRAADVLDQAPAQWNIYNRSYFNQRALDPTHIAEISIPGYAMTPELNDKDTAMIDRSRTQVVGVDIYALRVKRDLMVRYLELMPDGTVCVTSKQAEAYPPFKIPASDFEIGTAAIVGRVVRKGIDR